jgi:hypothetical protein
MTFKPQFLFRLRLRLTYFSKGLTFYQRQFVYTAIEVVVLHGIES